MGQKPPPNQPAIDDNIHRTVQRSALRKVRGVLVLLLILIVFMLILLWETGG